MKTTRALILLLLFSISAYSQTLKIQSELNDSGLSVTLVAIDDEAFPKMGTLTPDQQQIDFFGINSTMWINNHLSFKPILEGNVAGYSTISNSESAEYGNEKAKWFNTYLNTIYKALMIQIGLPVESQITQLQFFFLISIDDYHLIMARLNGK
jgi:hypothetical protein